MRTICSEVTHRRPYLELIDYARIGRRGSVTATIGGLAAVLTPNFRAILEYNDHIC